MASPTDCEDAGRPEPPVSKGEVEIRSKSTSALKELAARFNPPVNMKRTTGKKDMAKRLFLAIKKFKNQMKDINMLEQIFIESQQTDDLSRDTLAGYFKVFENTLLEMDQGYSLLHLPDNTMDMLATHRQRLSHRGCPIVVAGEVSSGKSTLLNLFLGESKLPVSTLSCTGRVCELAYGVKPCANLVTTDKQEIDIDLEKLDEFINMQGKDATFNKFDVVRLCVEVPFLKSGITLIDTPGIGHDFADSSIVKEYVKANDVFGFIFTIQSVAAGGVNQQFRNLLHTLAGDDFKDKNGNPKLDPTAVMFVCNFWDAVPEDEKDKTKKYIVDTITQMPFMVGFCPEKQLFFLDSKGAYAAFDAGYIADDYDLVIDGMKEFFKVGQMRKLEQSYLWIETVLQRCLHSLRSFVCWASQQRKLAASSVQIMYHELDGFEFMAEKQLRTFVQLIEINVDKVAIQLHEFLQKPETQKKLGVWTKDDMKGIQKYVEVKEIFEYMLDQMIDERISQVLLEWEIKYNKIGNTQSQFAEGIYQTFRIFHQQLDVLERDLHCVDSTDSGNGTNQARIEAMGEALSEVKRFLATINPGQKTDFKINYSVMHGHDIINGKGFQVGKKLKKFFKSEHVQNVPNRYSATFQKDLLRHMEYRTKAVVERLCTEEHTRIVVQEQFVPIQRFFEEKAASFKMRLNQNMALVKNLSKNVDFVVGTNRWYETYTETLKDLFDRVWSYSFKYMKTESYEDSELIPYDASGKTKTKLMDGGIYGQIELAYLKNSNTKITVKYLQDTSGNLMRESEVYNLISILRSVKKGLKSRIPVYMGTCYRKRALVFGGHLHTTRSYFLSQSSSVAQDIDQVMIRQFIQELGDALHFIHLEKLVHIEVSADSILVMQVGPVIVPMLTVLSEKKEVQLPSDAAHATVDNFLYLPPEVLHRTSTENFSGWYRATGDVYGLGLLILELFFKQPDVFLEKKQISLQEWMEVEDMGTELLNWVIAKEQTDPSPEWKELISQCIQADPSERISITKFVNKLKELSGIKAKGQHKQRRKLTQTPVEQLNLKSEKVIAPHLETGHRTTYKDVKKQAVRGPSNTSEEGEDLPSPPLTSQISAVEKEMSLSMMIGEAPEYALYNTGVAMRAATETLEIVQYSVQDIVNVLGTCKPRYCTFPLVGINEALRHKNLKTHLLWCELPKVAGSSLMKNMSSEERILMEAMFEIISSEASYQRSIDHIINEVIPHVTANYREKKHIDAADMKNLFSNITTVSEVSTNFFNNLEKAWQEDCQIDLEQLCNVLIEFLSNQTNREAYIIYFSNYSHQQEQLQKLLARLGHTHFPDYVKCIGNSRLSLMDGFLCLPIQRIPRYKILIDAIIKNIQDEVYNGPIGEKLQNCLFEAKSLTELCNGAVKTMHDMEYMLKLDRRMDFGNLKKIPVVSQSHLAKRHGTVGRIRPRTVMWPFWPYKEKWEIHCFTDIVFFCEVSDSRLAIKIHCPADKVLASCVTQSRAKLLNGDELPEQCDYILHVVVPEEAVGEEKDLIFSCKDESELLRWVEALCPFMSTLKADGQKYQQAGDSPLVIVVRSYRSKDAGEMCLYEGEIVKIIKKISFTDWTYGEKTGDGTRGWFPMSHTKEIDCLEKKQQLLVQEQKLLDKTRDLLQTRSPVRSYNMDDLIKLTGAIMSETDA